jgi:hypothetical protein
MLASQLTPGLRMSRSIPHPPPSSVAWTLTDLHNFYVQVRDRISVLVYAVFLGGLRTNRTPEVALRSVANLT